MKALIVTMATYVFISEPDIYIHSRKFYWSIIRFQLYQDSRKKKENEASYTEK